MKTLSNCFIVQTSNNLFYFFYSYDRSIYYNLYSNGHWLKPVTVIEEVNYNFSVSLSNDDIYIFCQDLFGNVILCLYKNQKWSFKKILENKSSDIYNINFQMIIDNMSFNLIYSMPTLENNAQLVYHSMDNSPQILDNIIPLNSMPFVTERVNNNLHLVFYQKKKKYHYLGYREFSTALKKWSQFNSFDETSYTYSDQSFLVTEDTIYTLYIVKGNFSYQLIYKYKKDSQWSSPYILYESNKIDMCCIFILNNQLWIVWCINPYVYTSISYDMGKTFNKAQRYIYNDSLFKASFISNKKTKDFYIKELFICGQSNPKILFIPDDFLYSQEKIIHTESISEKLNILKNKISIYEKQLTEKENQIDLLIEEKNLLLKTKGNLENQLAQKNIELKEIKEQLNQKEIKKTIILPYNLH